MWKKVAALNPDNVVSCIQHNRADSDLLPTSGWQHSVSEISAALKSSRALTKPSLNKARQAEVMSAPQDYGEAKEISLVPTDTPLARQGRCD